AATEPASAGLRNRELVRVLGQGPRSTLRVAARSRAGAHAARRSDRVVTRGVPTHREDVQGTNRNLRAHEGTEPALFERVAGASRCRAGELPLPVDHGAV